MTITHSPTISVVMSVYNGETFVARAIESILAQTYTDFEFIIVDDGSSDGTASILARYAASDARIIIIRNDSNIGLTKSLNKALAHGRGELIARQDADDESYPKRFAEQVQAFREHPDVALVTSYFDIAGYQGQDSVYRHAPTELEQRWAMLFYNHISGHSGVMLRASVLRALGGYKEDFSYAQDYDLWARIIREHRFHVIPKTLFKMNFHGGNISETKQAEQAVYALQTMAMQLNWLLGERLSEDAIRDLHYFWIHQYDMVQDYGRLQANLKRIWQQFTQKYRLQTAQQQRLRRETSMRFWQAHEQGIVLMWYAFQWDARTSLRRVIGMMKRKFKALL